MLSIIFVIHYFDKFYSTILRKLSHLKAFKNFQK